MIGVGRPIATTKPAETVLAVLTATDHQEAATVFLDRDTAFGAVFGVAEDPSRRGLIALPLLTEIPALHHLAGGG